MAIQYLARRLHLPAGEVLERQVVSVVGDGVIQWHSFETECHSMLLVNDLFLENDENGDLLLSSFSL